MYRDVWIWILLEEEEVLFWWSELQK